MKGKCGISISKDGPYLVSGNLPLKKAIITVGKENEPETWKSGEKFEKKESCALCRCGSSGNKPYCDGSHMVVGFDGTEIASRKKYLEHASKLSGPGLGLADVPELCAAARFCHRGGGTRKLVEKSADPKLKKIAIESACNCPSGRLVALDKTGKPIEPKFEPSIGIVEDPQAKCSGPLWVKGFIPIKSADGFAYEPRNRVTLCRCGQSGNKPFCDGTHISAKFNDGDKSLKR
jgi:CDGSH-type Zn-finger protein